MHSEKDNQEDYEDEDASSNTATAGEDSCSEDASFDYSSKISDEVASENDAHGFDEGGDAFILDNESAPPPDPFDGIDEDWPPWDALNTVDDEWPHPPQPNSLDEVDEDNPTPSRPAKRRRRYGGFHFHDVVASAKTPHTGPHRQRPADPVRAEKQAARAKERRQKKRLEKFQQNGRVPASSTIREYVSPSVPLTAGLVSTTLPAALGAYAAKRQDKKELYGSKVRRSLDDVLALGFQLVRWDGLCVRLPLHSIPLIALPSSTPRPLIDRNGLIIAVLVGQPHKPDYVAAVQRAFAAICKAGAKAEFPS